MRTVRCSGRQWMVSALGGGCLPRGVCLSGRQPPPVTEWQTRVKTLPCRNYVADGKYYPGSSFQKLNEAANVLAARLWNRMMSGRHTITLHLTEFCVLKHFLPRPYKLSVFWFKRKSPLNDKESLISRLYILWICHGDLRQTMPPQPGEDNLRKPQWPIPRSPANRSVSLSRPSNQHHNNSSQSNSILNTFTIGRANQLGKNFWPKIG